MRSERTSEGLAESDEPSLASAVGRLVWLAAKRATRRDVDDAPAATPDHVLHGAPRHVRRAKKVHAQGLVPRALPLLIAGIGDRMRLKDTGVVHQYVKAAQSIARGVDHPPDRRCVSEIRADDDVPVAYQRLRDLLGQTRASSVMDGNPIANGRERARNRRADPTRRPGNKHRPSVATAHLLVILRQQDRRCPAVLVLACATLEVAGIATWTRSSASVHFKSSLASNRLTNEPPPSGRIAITPTGAPPWPSPEERQALVSLALR